MKPDFIIKFFPEIKIGKNERRKAYHNFDCQTDKAIEFWNTYFADQMRIDKNAEAYDKNHEKGKMICSANTNRGKDTEKLKTEIYLAGLTYKIIKVQGKELKEYRRHAKYLSSMSDYVQKINTFMSSALRKKGIEVQSE